MHSLRETGSILLDAPPQAVMAAVERRLAAEDGVRVATPTRVEVRQADRLATFVVSASPEGTRLVHARAEAARLAGRRQEDVRRSVDAELDAIRRLLSAQP